MYVIRDIFARFVHIVLESTYIPPSFKMLVTWTPTNFVVFVGDYLSKSLLVHFFPIIGVANESKIKCTDVDDLTNK